jgi:hypothetical protein
LQASSVVALEVSLSGLHCDLVGDGKEGGHVGPLDALEKVAQVAARASLDPASEDVRHVVHQVPVVHPFWHVEQGQDVLLFFRGKLISYRLIDVFNDFRNGLRATEARFEHGVVVILIVLPVVPDRFYHT